MRRCEHIIYKYVYNGEIIYIGKTNRSLENRVKCHKKEEKFKPYTFKYYGVYNIFYFECANELETEIYERSLINNYHPILNEIDKHENFSSIIIEEKEWIPFSFYMIKNNLKGDKSDYIFDFYDFCLNEPMNDWEDSKIHEYIDNYYKFSCCVYRLKKDKVFPHINLKKDKKEILNIKNYVPIWDSRVSNYGIEDMLGFLNKIKRVYETDMGIRKRSEKFVYKYPIFKNKEYYTGDLFVTDVIQIYFDVAPEPFWVYVYCDEDGYWEFSEKEWKQNI